jgi:hypothetical protein
VTATSDVGRVAVTVSSCTRCPKPFAALRAVTDGKPSSYPAEIGFVSGCA